MNIAAPSLLVSYAYQSAGGGSAGTVAALAALESSAADVAALVQKTGSGQGFDLLQLSQSKALEVGTYGLQSAAGQGTQAIQNLLNPPTGYANPFLRSQTMLDPSVVGAYATYLYGQAQKAGQTTAFTQQSTSDALSSAEGFPTDLYDSARLSPVTSRLSSPFLFDPMDGNQDGFVSPAEEMAYSLSHPLVEILKGLQSAPSGFSAGSTTDTQAPTLYGGTGTLTTFGTTGPGLIDVFA